MTRMPFINSIVYEQILNRDKRQLHSKIAISSYSRWESGVRKLDIRQAPVMSYSIEY